ncbi:MAG: ABC transporter ATP-binding protein [Anaerolineales bacterium]|nr:ABC transporter ATP-binding protein [Anaerolineales bacterium]
MSESQTISAVEMRGITKRFPGVVANRDVDLTVTPGHIHALLGENGAGKSTLMNVLAGLYQAEEGFILLNGNRVRFNSPRDAIDHGIGMVHQHFMLVESLTVAENVILGQRPARFVIDHERVEEQVRELSKRYHLNVDPKAFIWQLSVGEQQRVEILKLLYRGADMLILDEPTAVLTPQESQELANILRQMTAEGKAIIFITHKLDEVMRFSDWVTVLRGGEVVATPKTSETTKSELARLMVGREVLFRLEKEPCQKGPDVLVVEGVRALNDKGLPALKGMSFSIRSGEILGVAGVAGNGQREIAEVITGLRPVTGGSIYVNDVEITNCTPRQAIETGVSHIPGDRLGVGLVPNLPVSDNLAMKAYRRPPLASGPLLNYEALRNFARNLVKGFNITTPSIQTDTRLLSGGNQQKVVLAREIDASSGMLVAVHPSRGLDVGATEAVRKTLLEQRDNGAAILLISEELDELMQLSDHIAVFYEGEIMGIVDDEEADTEELGLMMAGEKRISQTPSIEDDGRPR